MWCLIQVIPYKSFESRPNCQIFFDGLGPDVWCQRGPDQLMHSSMSSSSYPIMPFFPMQCFALKCDTIVLLHKIYKFLCTATISCATYDRQTAHCADVLCVWSTDVLWHMENSYAICAIAYGALICYMCYSVWSTDMLHVL